MVFEWLEHNFATYWIFMMGLYAVAMTIVFTIILILYVRKNMNEHKALYQAITARHKEKVDSAMVRELTATIQLPKEKPKSHHKGKYEPVRKLKKKPAEAVPGLEEQGSPKPGSPEVWKKEEFE